MLNFVVFTELALRAIQSNSRYVPVRANKSRKRRKSDNKCKKVKRCQKSAKQFQKDQKGAKRPKKAQAEVELAVQLSALVATRIPTRQEKQGHTRPIRTLRSLDTHCIDRPRFCTVATKQAKLCPVCGLRVLSAAVPVP